MFREGLGSGIIALELFRTFVNKPSVYNVSTTLWQSSSGNTQTLYDLDLHTDIVHCASCNPEPVLPETLLCKAVNELQHTPYKI